MTLIEKTRPTLPSGPEMALAETASRALASQFGKARGEPIIKVRIDEQETTLMLPAVAVRMLIDILGQMGKGNAVTVIPINAELTTQQAADFLNVSRPFLTKLLGKNVISYKKVGTHRRVRFEDLLQYKKKIEVEQDAVMDELVSESQKMGLY